MSKYGVKVDGKWRTVYFRNKFRYPGTDVSSVRYTLFVGEEEWGTIYQSWNGTWQAHSYWFEPMDLVAGFATRRAAAEYIIAHYRTMSAMDGGRRPAAQYTAKRK